MSTFALRPPSHVKSDSGQPSESEKLTIVASLIQGELLVKANNAVSAVTDGATIITHVMPTISANVIPGQTLEMPLIQLKSRDVWEMTAWHTSAGAAVIADSVLDAQPDFDVAKKTVSGQTQWVLDMNNTGSAAVRLIQRAPGFTATDQYPRVWVRFKNSVTQDF